MKKAALALLLLILAFLSCTDRSEDPVIRVKADDPEMNAAIARARSTVAEFASRLQNPQPKDDGFSVKKMITEGDDVEHFWLTDISYSKGLFSGAIGNDPQLVRNVTLGQKASVSETEISDWMYLDNGRMVGNFTLRVLLKRMPKEQADEIRTRFQIND